MEGDMADQTIEHYERLSRLYRTDPQQFEEERRRLIRETIETFGYDHQRKAYGLQFRIDSQLRRYRDPVMRMNKMVEIFWKGVYEFQEVMSDPDQYLSRRQQQARARVLPFRRRGELIEA